MRISKLLAVMIVLILVAGAAIAWAHNSKNNSYAPASSNNPNTQSGSNSSDKLTVNIRDMMFTPSQVTVAKGGTVTWTNNDSTTHTVVDDLSNVGGPSSGNIAPGQSYSFTFQKAGSYQYHCNIHPSMRGTIVVK